MTYLDCFLCWIGFIPAQIGITFAAVTILEWLSPPGPTDLGPSGSAVCLACSFYVSPLTAGIATAVLYARQNRPTPGFCESCGYDLRASKKTCPECGTAFAPEPR